MEQILKSKKIVERNISIVKYINDKYNNILDKWFSECKKEVTD